jgi:hypothetical protein
MADVFSKHRHFENGQQVDLGKYVNVVRRDPTPPPRDEDFGVFHFRVFGGASGADHYENRWLTGMTVEWSAGNTGEFRLDRLDLRQVNFANIASVSLTGDEIRGDQLNLDPPYPPFGGESPSFYQDLGEIHRLLSVNNGEAVVKFLAPPNFLDEWHKRKASTIGQAPQRSNNGDDNLRTPPYPNNAPPKSPGRIADAANSGPIVGAWHGGKSENDPVHGGYYNVAFSFTFAGNGEYTETVFMGAMQIMHAHGTYSLSPTRVPRDPTITHLLTFAPDQCEFASSEAAQIVALMALPANQNKNEYVGFAPLAGEGQMTLEDPVLGSAAAGFGLKRGQ